MLVPTITDRKMAGRVTSIKIDTFNSLFEAQMKLVTICKHMYVYVAIHRESEKGIKQRPYLSDTYLFTFKNRR